MKEVSFILDVHLPKLEVFCKWFEDNQSFIYVVESNKFSPRTNISLLSITISKDLYKRRSLGYTTLIHEYKQRTFSLSHSMNHYSYNCEEMFFGWWLKKWNLCFDTRESYHKNNNSNLQLSQLIWLHWKFVYQNDSEKVLVSLNVSNSFHHSNVQISTRLEWT